MKGGWRELGKPCCITLSPSNKEHELLCTPSHEGMILSAPANTTWDLHLFFQLILLCSPELSHSMLDCVMSLMLTPCDVMSLTLNEIQQSHAM